MSSQGETASENATLDEDVVTEILLRLPPASVLHSRAVCKTWRRITTDPSFVAAHADRQPAELLVVSGERSLLDTIPISPLVEDLTRRRSHLHYPEHCKVTAMMGSCDGLLLFEKSPPGYCSCDYFVCNPVTGQGIWLDLVPPTCRGNFVRMVGFYRHGPSGEHRLLVLANERHTGPAAHYVFSVAAASEPPRRLGPVADSVVLWMYSSVLNPHVHYRGKLHWTMHPVAESVGKILSFDIVSESFRLTSRPPWPSDRYQYPGDICLLELDGRLALTATETNEDSMELWVLEDYENDQSWSLRFRIDMPPDFHARWGRWAMDTGVPDVILVGDYSSGFAALYHLTEKRIVDQIEFENGKIGTSGHFLFKHSLVPYDFFDPY